MAMELEGRRSSDNSCSNGRKNVLKVNFSEEGEEYILTPIEAQSKLRPASKRLEKGECRRLEVGDMVLVPSSSLELGKSGFLKALIKDIYRQQHSPVETCSCKLEVLRLGAKKEEACSVSASQVRLLDLSSSINDNPVFCDWVGGGTTQGSRRLDTSDAESDMHAQLDAQINKIAMLADTLNEISSSTAELLADVSTKTRRTRRTRSLPTSYVENKRKVGKDSSLHTSKSLDKQPRLSPLAARAALAATVPITNPVKQVKPPSLPESKVPSVSSSDYTSDNKRARAALAATVPIRNPVKQVKPPSLLESKVLSVPSSDYTSDKRPVKAARNPPRKCRVDQKR